jgi:GNAT superfamily N-acetyltransferase
MATHVLHWKYLTFNLSTTMSTVIRKLSHLELSKYTDHLIRLAPEDRYLRFGYAITDDGITKYVDSQYRIKQVVLGAFDEDLNVVAAIEIVFDTSKYVAVNEVAEIGLSVEPAFRAQGIGSDLFQKALLITRNRSVVQLVSHCLTRNRWMMRIARKYGMTVVSDSGDTQGTLELEAPDVITLMGEVLGDGIALWDYANLASPTIFNPGFNMAKPYSVRSQ